MSKIPGQNRLALTVTKSSGTIRDALDALTCFMIQFTGEYIEKLVNNLYGCRSCPFNLLRSLKMYQSKFLLVYIYKIECQLQSFGTSITQT